MALSKKGPIGYKHSLPKASSPNKVVPASGTLPASPHGGDEPSPMVPLTGCLVLPNPLGNSRPAPRWRCPGPLAPNQPRTAGPQDSPSHGSRPSASNQRLVKEEMSGSPPMPREPLRPSFPLRRYHQGGSVWNLCTRREDWCQSVDPPKMSISTPRAMQVAPSQDPATLYSTISSPQQLDQGPIIRKLSRGGG